ncbi:hypothetical protein LTR35_011258 [Friedmanniomyces endolithicus]|uniref:Uncharacterized protein n=1 Tax=Friedmanniomyces endolithicus TaxID=329885 RepID=A0AAN6JD91_9PEZI|nr:hypothetical protein LTS00_016850 [Friedmanniomyces endolithicus]KAK0275210.1 hypothetical protein LTR35_011258 [Friedmanniomyces endolithicus]KAK0320149.1 hypothetical protein LTR82_008666 [Friedmanniomyces endolithicus]KAK0974841.1 hypothetical protein LTR54_016979 [Friedmanniomyces endolithicus]
MPPKLGTGHVTAPPFRGRRTTRGGPSNRGESTARGVQATEQPTPSAQVQKPTGGVMPTVGSPTHLPPASKNSRAGSPTKSAHESSPSRSVSPARLAMGSVTQTPGWLSVKFPDSMSAQDRVLHHNITLIAQNLSGLTNAITRLASSRASGKAAAKESDDPAIAANDKEIDLKLENAAWSGIIRDQLNVFKGVLSGSEEVMAVKKGKPAKDQSERFLGRMAEVAQQEQLDNPDATMQEAEDTGDSIPGALPAGAIHALLAGFSEAGLQSWYLKIIKAFDLGPKKVNARLSSDGAATKPAAKGAMKRKVVGGDDEDGEDGEADSRSPTKKAKQTEVRSLRESVELGSGEEDGGADEGNNE